MIRMAFAVACGGVIGTLLRFALATWVSAQWPRHFYLATLAVNLLVQPWAQREGRRQAFAIRTDLAAALVEEGRFDVRR